MRRSLRDAIVGFSLIGGVFAFAGTMLWLRGVKIGSQNWNVIANFENASGLSERSPVTYRGILVGSVKKISLTPTAVETQLEIDKQDLRLPLPVFAKVVNSSLLGGDVSIELISDGGKIPNDAPSPSSANCFKKQMLCNGGIIPGKTLSNLSSLSEEFEKLIRSAEKEDIVETLIDSAKQFDKTQKELEDLILQAKIEIVKAEPIIQEIHQASSHIRNILQALDNPNTIEDIQKTASSTRSLTQNISEITKDVNRIMEDEELMNAFRNVTIGLGELFNEIYPAKINYSGNK